MDEMVTIDAGRDPGRARLLQTVLDADDVVTRLVEPSGYGPYPGLESHRLLVRSGDEARAHAIVDTLRSAPRQTRPVIRWAAALLALVMLGSTVLGALAALIW
ncbi:MAG: hypothetical protein GY745_21465 [Actinomycetia bacterium]|nr:hypothetical protein [Actinomycetes bacterium]MCP4087589.1 hypothetical protein [Actinomycetes bacterium]